ncbi:MAG: hypothetical protein HGA78_10390, partial [Nitrospirales bacterium]|nr:hypothetical protein [Nitrospirales bacterium]
MRYAKQAVLFVAVLVWAFAFTGLAYAAEKCPLCGMNIAGNENTAYEVTMADGKQITYCC